MNRFNHLMQCLNFADNKEEEDEMWSAYNSGLDPFIMTGKGIPYNEYNDDDWDCCSSFNNNNQWGNPSSNFGFSDPTDEDDW